MSKWNTSNYRQRKSERLARLKPEWVKNPETGEEFELRRIGGMAYTIAGYMPHTLTAEAIQGWKAEGVEVSGGDGDLNSKAMEDGKRNLELMAKVVQDACVTPKLVPGATGDDELDPADLDDSDLLFIFRYATGQVGSDGVPLRGGDAIRLAEVKSLRKTPGRRARTGTSG